MARLERWMYILLHFDTCIGSPSEIKSMLRSVRDTWKLLALSNKLRSGARLASRFTLCSRLTFRIAGRCRVRAWVVWFQNYIYGRALAMTYCARWGRLRPPESQKHFRCHRGRDCVAHAIHPKRLLCVHCHAHAFRHQSLAIELAIFIEA